MGEDARLVMISAAVEGIVDAEVARKLVAEAGGEIGNVYEKDGKPDLRKRINGYNNAARHAPWHAPWLVLVDLDNDADCAPPLRNVWLPEPAPLLCFRIAVRQVEAWLMADHDTLADFLSVAKNKIPDDPERLPNAKEAMVNLARRSRRQAIFRDMVPRQGSGRSVGPAYSSRMIEYIDRHWRPQVAAHRADSLRRAIACLKALVAGAARE